VLLTYEHPGNSFFGTVINKFGHLLLEGAILARFFRTWNRPWLLTEVERFLLSVMKRCQRTWIKWNRINKKIYTFIFFTYFKFRANFHDFATFEIEELRAGQVCKKCWFPKNKINIHVTNIPKTYVFALPEIPQYFILEIL